MKRNLLDTLLRFAASSQHAHEDPITEILAWLLWNEPAFMRAFVELLSRRVPALARASLQPDTQVITPRARGGGVCRYDLVLEDRRAPARVVVELKIDHDLTPSGAELDSTCPRHQVHDYLELAEADPPGSHWVFTLAPGLVDVGEDAERHPCFGGHLRWQEVHDAFARVLRLDRSDALEPTAKALATQFLEVMEARQMAHPKLTYDGAVAARRFMRFRQSFTEVVTAAWNEMHADGTLEGFIKVNAAAWQDEHQRLGYRLWVRSKDTTHFGFIGLYLGDDTTFDDVPDLYFFLEAPPKSPAQRALEQRAADVTAIVASLNARDARTVWRFSPGEHQVVWATQSIAHALADTDPRAAILAWFRQTVLAARDGGLLSIYREAVKDS
ncbi:hypothetical protein [Sandaracinus amylolyticus]|uniref:hypothetical protein n=1 Tax=Sandaracinus amylolyticus TaxID=927083 RepID=UPI001F278E8F|nr:hypothetical protein [Sandaracinus amylolyticus]UJR86704.1 Hypothetical protein I5071_88050 [Sandaracinus amylolyticus]